MKSILTITLTAMLLALPVLAGDPPAIRVNGIINLFGSKTVMFKLGSDTENFMLTEGQSRDGIQLLAVDTRTGKACFDNRGKIQTIRISSAPETTATQIAAAGGRGNNSAAALRATLSNSSYPATTAIPIMTANGTVAEFAGGRAMPAGPNASNNSGDNNSGSDSSGSSAGSDAGSSTKSNFSSGADSQANNRASVKSDDHWKNSWRYHNSQEIEAARIRDAAAVRAGVAEPYPLTPLTPAGTSAELVSSEQIYFR